MSERTPILSTTDRGARMTELAPGQPVGRVRAGHVLLLLIGAAAWAAAASVPYAALLGLAPSHDLYMAMGSPWAVGAAAVTAFVAATITATLHGQLRETFGQSRVAGLFSGLSVLLGLCGSAIGWTVAGYAAEPTPAFDLDRIATSPEIPRELGVLAGALVTLLTLLLLARLALAVPHARARQVTIERLRRTGTRYEGTIAARVFLQSWLWDLPQFTVQVSYADRRVVTVYMRTDPPRVPVLGSPVVVLADSAGAVHVEFDPDTPLTFETEYQKYVPSEG
ncbi:hypothetical protein [Jiangella anatolica]|uniref:Uncharacterized protein n=1 Tax=Jiangella anatolica TaxID=2670374 RepID=A0A2W2BDE9_9ACTN|nr:hypothetical protein [Jiangella anatolica]PZF83340.1 hypothetical protein C1I92_12925 [Jiangella anatolica]